MVKLSEWGKVLGTRDIGEKIRLQLLDEMESSEQPVDVSFEGVLMVSHSFADECFGKLILAIGAEQFKQAFKITKLNDKMVRLVLNDAVRERVTLSNKQPVKTQ